MKFTEMDNEKLMETYYSYYARLERVRNSIAYGLAGSMSARDFKQALKNRDYLEKACANLEREREKRHIAY